LLKIFIYNFKEKLSLYALISPRLVIVSVISSTFIRRRESELIS
jgi:hypothetical protein